MSLSTSLQDLLCPGHLCEEIWVDFGIIFDGQRRKKGRFWTGINGWRLQLALLKAWITSTPLRYSQISETMYKE